MSLEISCVYFTSPFLVLYFLCIIHLSFPSLWFLSSLYLSLILVLFICLFCFLSPISIIFLSLTLFLIISLSLSLSLSLSVCLSPSITLSVSLSISLSISLSLHLFHTYIQFYNSSVSVKQHLRLKCICLKLSCLPAYSNIVLNIIDVLEHVLLFHFK